MDTTRYFALLSPFLIHFVNSSENKLFQAHSTRKRRQFLQRCLEEHVIPKSLLPKRLREMSEEPFNSFCVQSLKLHIKLTKRKEFLDFKKLAKARMNFFSHIPNNWCNMLCNSIYLKLRNQLSTLNIHLENKLDNLISESIWTKKASDNGVVNLSSKALHKDLECALGYGMSFAISDKPKTVDVMSSVEKFAKNSDINKENLEITKGLVYSALYSPSFCNIPLRFQKAISSVKKDPDLHITKADKSNSVVILDKSDYNRKMLLMLEDRSTYEKLTSNPLDESIKCFNKIVKSELRNHKVILDSVITIAPSLPYLYGLVKTHKQGNPMRPIISSVGSIAYKLSKFLVKTLSPLLGTISNSHLKNSVDLVDKLNNLAITSDHRMVSFDVTSLFTKVPIDDLLEYLSRILDNYEITIQTPVILKLVKLCIKDCVFTFNGSYYRQIFGMAMGNPLSPLLSNIYMEFFESRLIPSIWMSQISWFRYVDDISVFFFKEFEHRQLVVCYQ